MSPNPIQPHNVTPNTQLVPTSCIAEVSTSSTQPIINNGVRTYPTEEVRSAVSSILQLNNPQYCNNDGTTSNNNSGNIINNNTNIHGSSHGGNIINNNNNNNNFAPQNHNNVPYEMSGIRIAPMVGDSHMIILNGQIFLRLVIELLLLTTDPNNLAGIEYYLRHKQTLSEFRPDLYYKEFLSQPILYYLLYDRVKKNNKNIWSLAPTFNHLLSIIQDELPAIVYDLTLIEDRSIIDLINNRVPDGAYFKIFVMFTSNEDVKQVRDLIANYTNTCVKYQYKEPLYKLTSEDTAINEGNLNLIYEEIVKLFGQDEIHIWKSNEYIKEQEVKLLDAGFRPYARKNGGFPIYKDWAVRLEAQYIKKQRNYNGFIIPKFFTLPTAMYIEGELIDHMNNIVDAEKFFLRNLKDGNPDNQNLEYFDILEVLKMTNNNLSESFLRVMPTSKDMGPLTQKRPHPLRGSFSSPDQQSYHMSNSNHYSGGGGGGGISRGSGNIPHTPISTPSSSHHKKTSAKSSPKREPSKKKKIQCTKCKTTDKHRVCKTYTQCICGFISRCIYCAIQRILSQFIKQNFDIGHLEDIFSQCETCGGTWNYKMVEHSKNYPKQSGHNI